MSNLKYIFVHGLSGWGSYDEKNQKTPYWGMKGGDLVAFLREKGFDSYDMHVDNAAEMNWHLSTFPDIYYFSVPCSSTKDTGNGIHRPQRKITDPFFVRRSIQIGCYSGTTGETKSNRGGSERMHY